MPLQYSKAAILAFWRVTKPNGKLDATYKDLLFSVLAISPADRFEKPFFKEKQKGGKRRIVPAKSELKIVQRILADWVRKNTTSYDYCYKAGNDGSVLGAIGEHQLFTSAVYIDLKAAYEQVTTAKIQQRFTGMLTLSELSIFIDLVTYKGKLPQGCASSPYVFNAVFAPIDLRLLDLKRMFPDIVAVTRYVDDILITVNNSDRKKLDYIAARAMALLTVKGYHGRMRKYNIYPVEYLHAWLFPKSTALSPTKYSEVVTSIVLASKSAHPAAHQKSVMGSMQWVVRVYKKKVPAQLLQVFENYYRSAHLPYPAMLVQMLSPKLKM